MEDHLENWLHKQVCNENMTLQEAIKTDWKKAYLKYGCRERSIIRAIW